MYVEGGGRSGSRWVETVTEWERIRVVGETDRDAQRTKATTRAMQGGGGCVWNEEVVIRARCFGSNNAGLS